MRLTTTSLLTHYPIVPPLPPPRRSHILQNALPAISWVTLTATLVASYATAYNDGLLPEGFPPLLHSVVFSAFITNTSVALSLLLVFRTNSSYGRWDEARKMWGGLLNRSRDIMRQGATCFPDDQVEAKKALARWVVAFARALRIHFQPEVTIESELKNILTPAELEMLSKSQHRPVRAIHAISQVRRPHGRGDCFMGAKVCLEGASLLRVLLVWGAVALFRLWIGAATTHNGIKCKGHSRCTREMPGRPLSGSVNGTKQQRRGPLTLVWSWKWTLCAASRRFVTRA